MGIAIGLRRAAQLQPDLEVQQVPVSLLARWGRTPEAICAQVQVDLVELDLRTLPADEIGMPAALLDRYLGLYLPAVRELIQPFSPTPLTWADLGIYALHAAGQRQPEADLARLREVGLVTAAAVVVAPAELVELLDQAAAGTLTTLDDDGQRVRVELTALGRAIWEHQQIHTREALC
ncbi:MAG TPA: hypothetical protein VFS21_37500 [Roseiflexaceae bacterium]|nr:hypothetical protein [Roseiflexaceae bacterium]